MCERHKPEQYCFFPVFRLCADHSTQDTEKNKTFIHFVYYFFCSLTLRTSCVGELKTQGACRRHFLGLRKFGSRCPKPRFYWSIRFS